MTEGQIQLTIVTPDRLVARADVEEIQVPGREGYLGILRGHAPLFSELKIGEVSYKISSGWRFLAVAWGFVEVLPDQVRILAETAEQAHEIDVERALRSKERAEQRLTKSREDINFDRALAALERALVRIQVSRKTLSGRIET